MIALLWKDYRHNRPVLIVGAVLFLIPYLAVAGVKIFHPMLFPDIQPGVGVTMPWYRALIIGSGSSLMASLLTVALISGYAFAGERNDRSAEFLGCLPISRFAICLSKAVFAIGVCLAIWIVNLGVLFGALRVEDVLLLGAGYAPRAFPLEPWCSATVTAVLIFGVGWLSSSLVNSPTIAAGLGIASPLIGGVLYLFAWATPPVGSMQREAQIATWYIVAALVLGSAAFLAGTAYYLRSTRP